MDILYALMNVQTKHYLRSFDNKVMVWDKSCDCLEYKAENRVSDNYMICTNYKGEDYVLMSKKG